MSDILTGLNLSQFEAVTTENNRVLCLAGAGTGKTRTLTHRIAYLHEQGISCSRMAALTFTRLAGKEMKERLFNLVGKKETSKLFCNTFHAFCVQVLRKYGHLNGYNANFSIYDQKEREVIIKEIIEEFHVKVKMDDVIENLQNTNKKVDFKKAAAKQVADEYRYRLKRNNSEDLELLLIDTFMLMQKNPEIVEELHNKYTYMFIDEYQDTDKIQLEIVKLINPEYIFAVGDDSQSIYAWRGAHIENILNFDKEFKDCEIIKIEENYRSTKPIIDCSNRLIRHNVKQLEKTLETDKDGEPIEFFTADNEKDEADIITKKIITLKDKYKYSDFAILTRNNKQQEVFASIFRQYHIPYQLIGKDNTAFNNEDIKMVLSYVEASINTYNDNIIKKIINYPEKRITTLEISEYELEALNNNQSLYDILKEKQDEKIQNFVSIIDELANQNLSDKSIANSYKITLDTMELTNYYIGQGKMDTVMTLTRADVDFRAWEMDQSKVGESTSAEVFLKWLVTRQIEDAHKIENRNAVKVLTVHSSKGLEFPVVFTVGMNQDVFPSKRSDIEEERRLCYVAFTRAKDKLFVSRSLYIKPAFGFNDIKTEPSQFLEEAGIK